MANTPSSVDWVIVNTPTEMREFFFSRLDLIRAAARNHGYAIALHGSCRRDFDLIAVPWIENPMSNLNILANAIAIAACGIARKGPYTWEEKPHGRKATSIPICWVGWKNPQDGAGHIDLSVMPSTVTQYIEDDGEINDQ